MATYDARRTQQPPPEEAEPITRKGNAQTLLAERLSAAFNREDALRKIRVCDTAARIRPGNPTEGWMDLARCLMAANVDDPERFIHAVFKESVAKDYTLAHGPFSNSLRGEGLPVQLERYSKYCERADIHLEEDWQNCARQFELAVADLRVRFPNKESKLLWHFALANQRYELSPLFKYCIAASEGIEEIVSATSKDALLQLLGDPQGYIRVWEDRIPEALKAAAFSQMGIQ